MRKEKEKVILKAEIEHLRQEQEKAQLLLALKDSEKGFAFCFTDKGLWCFGDFGMTNADIVMILEFLKLRVLGRFNIIEGKPK